MLVSATGLIDKFEHYFPGNDENTHVFFAPGRVNLIGEHTDYNDGFVLPSALSVGTYLCIRTRNDLKVRLRSANFPNIPVEFSLNKLEYEVAHDWGNFPKGVLKELIAAGVKVNGADIYYEGNLPNGAGLSSSASIAMVTAYAFDKLAGSQLSTTDLALLCQRMENRFIGVNTGIMDQYAVGFGKRDHAVFLNCGTMETEQVPLKLGDYKIVITNTNKTRGLADSKYNERRSECDKGLAILQTVYPEALSLSDISLENFDKHKHLLPETIAKRVRHVITENQRVLLAVAALKKGDLDKMGQLMRDSHLSLKNDYEVTGKELDTLFDLQKQAPGVIGTRMTGAGFGGCTVSIVHEDYVDSLEATVAPAYRNKTGLDADFYIYETGDGAKQLT